MHIIHGILWFRPACRLIPLYFIGGIDFSTNGGSIALGQQEYAIIIFQRPLIFIITISIFVIIMIFQRPLIFIITISIFVLMPDVIHGSVHAFNCALAILAQSAGL